MIVFDELAGNVVLGCRPMQLQIGGDRIRVTPVGPMVPCGQISQVE